MVPASKSIRTTHTPAARLNDCHEFLVLYTKEKCLLLSVREKPPHVKMLQLPSSTCKLRSFAFTRIDKFF